MSGFISPSRGDVDYFIAPFIIVLSDEWFYITSTWSKADGALVYKDGNLVASLATGVSWSPAWSDNNYNSFVLGKTFIFIHY